MLVYTEHVKLCCAGYVEMGNALLNFVTNMSIMYLISDTQLCMHIKFAIFQITNQCGFAILPDS